MRQEVLEKNPFADRIIKVAVAAGPFILLGVAVILVKEQDGLLWGLGIILVTAAIENYFMISLLTSMECPQCRQTLKRSLSEKSFRCYSCEVEWKLPGK